MFNVVINSFKFNNAYNKNAFIYRLRQLPLIGNKIPKDLYHSYLLDVLINLCVGVYTLIKPFLGKFIYLLFFLLIPMEFLKNSNSFVNIFVFLTLIGGIFNTFMFNPTKNKYYAMILMRMNAKKYAISHLIWFLLENLISFYPAVILYGYMYNVNIFLLILLPIFVVLTKLIGNYILLKYYDITNRVLSENNFYLIGSVSLVGLSLAYLLPYFGYSITPIVFITIFVLFFILGIISLIYILKNNNYNQIYKKMLNLNSVIFNTEKASNDNMKKQYSLKIESNNVTSNKEGYEYFNDLFMKRHRSLLTKSAIKFAVIIAVVLIILMIGSYIDKSSYSEINQIPLKSLPYFVFIMYFINRGSTITQAMFINCDNSMLAYRFYREPKVILSLFKTRLKTLIKINMIPTLVLAIGLPLLLFVTGGTSNYLNYILLFISIVSLSVFFSVHHLVIYYLLQPYDIDMKAKSGTYGMVNGITYFVCYMFIDVKVPTITFATIVTVFAICYVLISLLLVYKYAPNTFKLKQ
ncbi:MAG: hypothetical protein IJO43_02505 [Bacilli bacterium]|nr:hypothetical protein [Bacilli bacterium]